MADAYPAIVDPAVAVDRAGLVAVASTQTGAAAYHDPAQGRTEHRPLRRV